MVSYRLSEPLEKASLVFEETLVSLMAHSIRATQNIFKQHRLSLDLVIIADTHDRLGLTSPPNGVTSVLRSQLIKRTEPGGLVKASVFLHKNCSRNLARICIAHELYHLLIELDQYIASGKSSWHQIPKNDDLEEACDLFAFELCKKHDQFNRNGILREVMIYFPDGIFSTMAHHLVNKSWPDELGLDPNAPFHKRNGDSAHGHH